MSDQTKSPSEGSRDEHILVVEDSSPNRSILVLLLRKLGYQIIECADGEQAWKALHENKHVNLVAVVSDLLMPNVDGLELLGRVRSDEYFKEIPFVLLTAVTDQDFIARAKALDVNGYILKPITFQRVALKIAEIFPGRRYPSLAG